MKKNYFGVMLDTARNGVMKPEEVKKYARIIQRMGYNMIWLYMEDTYEVTDEPYFGYLRGRYTKEELKDMDAYCTSIGVELIPCVQTLGHLATIFRWFDYDKALDTGGILRVGAERTYTLIEHMFKTLRECFTTKNIHIGMDEAHMMGRGRYFDEHGYRDHFKIFLDHLNKVTEIAGKYGFKPQIWSDMFFRICNKEGYYIAELEKPNPIPQEVCKKVPPEVDLVYWDYYHDTEKFYEEMIKYHQAFSNDIWFAGGAWSWIGFAPDNARSLKTMIPAMKTCKRMGIDKIVITLWGDGGKECSFYALLPSLFALKMVYDGETDMEVIKAQFKEILGENFDDMMALDFPNCFGKDSSINGFCRYALFSDPFVGVMDYKIPIGRGNEYKSMANSFMEFGKNSQYKYVFDCMAALCETLSVKYDLGAKTRKYYKEKNIELLKILLNDYNEVEGKLDILYDAFRTLWMKENKPYGFEVQDQRFGGLKQRIKSCRKMLIDYINGEQDSIPELEENLLDYCGGANLSYGSDWKKDVSVNVL